MSFIWLWMVEGGTSEAVALDVLLRWRHGRRSSVLTGMSSGEGFSMSFV
jgi:hypothetical protein